MSTPTDPAGATDSLDATDHLALAAAARECIDALARSTDVAAFQELLGLSQAVGEALGASARSLAEANSWTAVGGLAGTTKQAAWARWRT
ncbi:MAG: hypothetical protein L0H96_06665 [Humibacillus sp.]|nr:hypothetical protein [Humibacillus sp.]MDN5776574.1 hypothetical protein [Humibacillus sp.]